LEALYNAIDGLGDAWNLRRNRRRDVFIFAIDDS
jgi:hypothetical protein